MSAGSRQRGLNLGAYSAPIDRTISSTRVVSYACQNTRYGAYSPNIAAKRRKPGKRPRLSVGGPARTFDPKGAREQDSECGYRSGSASPVKRPSQTERAHHASPVPTRPYADLQPGYPKPAIQQYRASNRPAKTAGSAFANRSCAEGKTGKPVGNPWCNSRWDCEAAKFLRRRGAGFYETSAR